MKVITKRCAALHSDDQRCGYTVGQFQASAKLRDICWFHKLMTAQGTPFRRVPSK